MNSDDLTIISHVKRGLLSLNIWDLTITQPERFYYVFQAENDAGSCLIIETNDIVSGTQRILNLIMCDCTNPLIYVSDLTGNRNLIEEVMNIRQVMFQIE